VSRRTILSLAFMTALLLATAAPTFARVGFWVGVAPPAPIVQPMPPTPAPGYVWQPGYWSWNGVKWVWVPGTYVVPPYPGAVWVGGHWVPRGHGWTWVDGRWRR
jgi:hypothetical protein